jgi:hypothetical protein
MKTNHSGTGRSGTGIYWSAESRRRFGARDLSYAALQVYCAHILENSSDPNGYRRAGQCFLTDGPTALAAVFSSAVLALAPGDDKAERIVRNHAAAASRGDLWKWIVRSSDETVLLAILYAMKAAEGSGILFLEGGPSRLTLHLQQIAPECSDPLFLSELRNAHAIARAEERDGNLMDRVVRHGQYRPEPVKSPMNGPKRTKPSRVRLWTGNGGTRHR